MKLNLGLMLSVFLSLSACKAVDQIEPSSSQAESKTYTKQQVLVAAHAAITSADASALAEISTFPIHIRNQEWYAGDGYFGLGNVIDHHLQGRDELVASGSIKNVGIEGLPDSFQPMTYEGFNEFYMGVEFVEIEELWKNLDISVYIRGEHDVLHIVVIGTDSETHKVRAIYMN